MSDIELFSWTEMFGAPKDGTVFIYQNEEGDVSTCSWQKDDCGFNWYDISGDQIAYPVRRLQRVSIQPALSVS